MSHQDLRALLAQLHDQLGTTATLDDASRILLTSALRDIESALARNPPDAGSTTDQLETLAVQFEVEHPTLVVALRRLVDALGKAGI
jgi:hypothetical protein